jgi:hypothetical protein
MQARLKVPSRRLLVTWILLLAGAQIADVLTTGVDMAYGAMEANRLVAALLSLGGLGLVFGLKLLLVAALGIACLVLTQYAEAHPTLPARAAHAFVWRAIQISALGLVTVAVHNTALLAQIA